MTQPACEAPTFKVSAQVLRSPGFFPFLCRRVFRSSIRSCLTTNLLKVPSKISCRRPFSILRSRAYVQRSGALCSSSVERLSSGCPLCMLLLFSSSVLDEVRLVRASSGWRVSDVQGVGVCPALSGALFFPAYISLSLWRHL